MEHDLKGPPVTPERLSAIEDEIRSTLQKALPNLPAEALDQGIHRFRQLRKEIMRPVPIEMTLPADLGLSKEQLEGVQRAIADNMQHAARLMREQIVYPLMIELIRLELATQLAELAGEK